MSGGTHGTEQESGDDASRSSIGGDGVRLIDQPFAKIKKEVAVMKTSAARGSGRKSTPVKVSSDDTSSKSKCAEPNAVRFAAKSSAELEFSLASREQNQTQSRPNSALDSRTKTEPVEAQPITAQRLDTEFHAAVSYGYISDEHVASLLRKGGPQADPNAPPGSRKVLHDVNRELAIESAVHPDGWRKTDC